MSNAEKAKLFLNSQYGKVNHRVDTKAPIVTVTWVDGAPGAVYVQFNCVCGDDKCFWSTADHDDNTPLDAPLFFHRDGEF